jgi:hypothetical protein
MKASESALKNINPAKGMTRQDAIKDLRRIPGVGSSIAADLWNIGIRSVSDLKAQDPEALYDLSNRFAGAVQDRCLLYVFRCAVYYAEHPAPQRDAEKLKWWNWKDHHKTPRRG